MEKKEDVLYDAIIEFLRSNPNRFYDREDIVDELINEYPDITPQKVTIRASKAVKKGLIVKDIIKRHYDEEGVLRRKAMGYMTNLLVHTVGGNVNM